jgi:hypothetical protein
LFQRINTRLRAGGSAGGIAFDFRSGALDPRISFTRASAAWYFDSAGNLVQASTNEPRFDYDPATLQARGLLIESGRTNGVRNPRLEGAVAGTPGTNPTNMVFSGPAGLTQQIVEVSTENNMNFVSVRWSGTTSASGRLSWFMESGGIIAATVGQTFAAANFCKTVAGTYPTAGAIFSFAEQDATATTIATGIVAVQAPFASGTRISASRVSASYTMAQATAAFVRPVWGSDTINSGVAVDVTIRFAAPQTELGTFRTSPIFPAVGSPAASTRGFDTAAMSVAFGSNFTLFEEFQTEARFASVGGSINHYVSADDETTTNRFSIQQRSEPSALIFLELNIGGVITGLPKQPLTVGAIQKHIGAYSNGDVAYVANGGSVQTQSGLTLPALTRLHIQNPGAAPAGSVTYVRRVAVYPSRLSNATLQALTA